SRSACRMVASPGTNTCSHGESRATRVPLDPVSLAPAYPRLRQSRHEVRKPGGHRRRRPCRPRHHDRKLEVSMSAIDDSSFSADDFRRLGALTLDAWRSGIDLDWSVPAATLEWSCLRTADHTVHCAF